MSQLINNRVSLVLAGAALAVALVSGAPARAADADTTLMYQGAIESNNKCVSESTQAQEDTTAALGAKAGNFSLLVGDLLTGTNKTRGEARVERFSLGCSAPWVAERLNFYKTNIQPKL